MLTLYTDPEAQSDGYSYVPFLYPFWGPQPAKLTMWAHAFDRWIAEAPGHAALVADPADADYLVAPNDWFYAPHHRARFDRLLAAARAHGKRLIVFNHGDTETSLDDPAVLALNTSIYRVRPALRHAEVLAMPAYTGDSMRELARPWTVRSHGAVPVVGFCGWARPQGLAAAAKLHLRSAAIELQALAAGDGWRHRKKGLHFRARALAALGGGGRAIATNFIVRDAFFNGVGLGAEAADAEASRRAYLHNILDSDYTLCVKGDGNFSIRFYETLSLGRLPVLVDTGCVLPLADEIPYADLMPIVPAARLEESQTLIADFHRGLAPAAYEAMQHRARAIWEDHLSPHGFFATLCARLEAAARGAGPIQGAVR